MGPWRVQANRTLARNPFSWTRVAGMVFVEQPVGVGFSYTTSLDEVRMDRHAFMHTCIQFILWLHYTKLLISGILLFIFLFIFYLFSIYFLFIFHLFSIYFLYLYRLLRTETSQQPRTMSISWKHFSPNFLIVRKIHFMCRQSRMAATIYRNGPCRCSRNRPCCPHSKVNITDSFV